MEINLISVVKRLLRKNFLTDLTGSMILVVKRMNTHKAIYCKNILLIRRANLNKNTVRKHIDQQQQQHL